MFFLLSLFFYHSNLKLMFSLYICEDVLYQSEESNCLLYIYECSIDSLCTFGICNNKQSYNSFRSLSPPQPLFLSQSHIHEMYIHSQAQTFQKCRFQNKLSTGYTDWEKSDTEKKKINSCIIMDQLKSKYFKSGGNQERK